MIFFKKSLKQLVTEYHASQSQSSSTMNTRRSTGHSKQKPPSTNYAATWAASKTLTPELYAINAKICGLVALHPCMYDRSHSHYMRKSSVESAWKEIAKEMRDSVNNCKERWRNIRTSFARSINVHRASGSNRIKPYYLNDELQFLKKHITPGVPIPVRGRRSRGSIRSKGDHNEDDEDFAEGEEEDEAEEATLAHLKQSLSSDEHSRDSSALADTEHAQSNDSHAKDEQELLGQSTGDESYPQQPKTIKKSSRSACPPKKRRRVSAHNDEDFKEDEHLPSITSEAASIPPSAPIDFDDAFLQGLRPEIKHMNFHQKLYFKRRVYELLGEIFLAGEAPNELQATRPNVNGVSAVPTPTASVALQHLGLTLQLPKLVHKTKDM